MGFCHLSLFLTFAVAGTVLRGGEIAVEADGRLFSSRLSNNVSVLRTVGGFGISSVAIGRYSCIANNGFNTTTRNITVDVTGKHWTEDYVGSKLPNSKPFYGNAAPKLGSSVFLRFSTIPLNGLQLRLRLSSQQLRLRLSSQQLTFPYINTAVC